MRHSITTGSGYIRHPQLLLTESDMKKILLAFAMVMSFVAAKAQLANGSQAPDFTLTDINGNTFTLSEALAAGKTVVIDFSATWCGPCWGYHGSGALDDLHHENGPEGTCSNDVVVLFIEGDTSTGAADLAGTTANSQGDWITGTPYPIFDPTNETVMSAYQIAYFPTVYRICPDGTVTEIGQASAGTIVDSIEDCGNVNDAAAKVNGSLTCTSELAAEVELRNVSNGTLTSCNIRYAYDGGAEQTFNWTGSVAEGQSTIVTLPATTLTSGAHVLDVHIDDPNGVADGNKTNNCSSATINVISSSGQDVPFAENFTATGFPYANWTIANPDNGITWSRVSTATGSLKLDCYNYSSDGAIDDVIPAPYDLTGTTDACVTFKVAHRAYSATYTDRLQVLASNDCGTTWDVVYDKAGLELASIPAYQTSAFTPTASQWRVECIDLNQFVGDDKVFLAFRGINGYGNNIYLDEITVNNFACALGIEEESQLSEFKAFPNPTNGNATLTYSLKGQSAVFFDVYSITGEKVMTINAGNQPAGTYNQVLDMSVLSSGLYMVNIRVNDSVSTLRLTVQK